MKLKGKEGITLIALVVTIIVLMILAGVSINLMFGQYGIVTRAQGAKTQMEIAQFKEDVQLKLADLQAQKMINGGSVTTADLENTIKGAGGIVVKDAEGNITGAQVGDTTIKIEEIKGDISVGTPTYKAYSVGDVVTLKSTGESFYVIKASSTSEEKVTLLAAKNIKTSTLLQADDANTVAFCTDPDETNEGYWTSIKGITYPYDLNNVESERATAINYAKAYGTAKGGTGRLMTVEEAFEITGLRSEGTISSPDWIKTTDYWLGSAVNAFRVLFVYGEGSNLDSIGYHDGTIFGVRPVIEISKSLIS